MQGSGVASLPLSQVETWIFDLDNTLYPASCNLFAQIDQRMSSYIQAKFGASAEDAHTRQKALFREHGTTLRGLMLEHDVDPTEFLEFVHDIDLSPVPHSPLLADALLKLPGRKLIYTNGSTRHAENVLRHMGIRPHFAEIFDIVEASYIPKPDPRPYEEMIRRHGVDPARAAMVEDIARNLAPAAALGMTTVWVKSRSEWAQPDADGTGGIADLPPHIHHAVEDLAPWLADLAGLQAS